MTWIITRLRAGEYLVNGRYYITKIGTRGAGGLYDRGAVWRWRDGNAIGVFGQSWDTKSAALTDLRRYLGLPILLALLVFAGGCLQDPAPTAAPRVLKGDEVTGPTLAEQRQCWNDARQSFAIYFKPFGGPFGGWEIGPIGVVEGHCLMRVATYDKHGLRVISDIWDVYANRYIPLEGRAKIAAALPVE
jgi:hypothetical protein